MFIAYPKIHRLGKEEVEGILEFGEVTVQEKIDGANTSIWIEDGVIHIASRNRELKEDESFNGFMEYVATHEGIKALLEDHPTYVLYGEWLVRHTIAYNETSYKQWYMFDILDNGRFLHQDIVHGYARTYGINYPQVFCEGKLTLEEIMKYVGQSNLGDKGEGVVIKNEEFTNKFGDLSYAKIVTEKFKEDNAITFGGNNKHSDSYWEMWIVNKFCTLARVQKIMNKLQPEIDKRLDKEHTSRIAGICYHDMMTEEIWTIQAKVQSVNFKKLKSLATRKFIKIYHDILEGHISVAYGNEVTL